jgi:hypothetical protein
MKKTSIKLGGWNNLVKSVFYVPLNVVLCPLFEKIKLECRGLRHKEIGKIIEHM